MTARKPWRTAAGWAVPTLALLAACASYEGAPRADWIPTAGQTDVVAAGPVLLRASQQAQLAVAELNVGFKLQVGAIAELALRKALRTGIESGPAGAAPTPASPLPTDGEARPTLVIDAVRLQAHGEMTWWMWVPPLSMIARHRWTPTLTIDLSLHDGRGRLAWSRSYEDQEGRVQWTSGGGRSIPLPEDAGAAVHVAAWRIAQRAADDVLRWSQEERMRPRQL
jgi:hypothetical protein